MNDRHGTNGASKCCFGIVQVSFSSIGLVVVLLLNTIPRHRSCPALSSRVLREARRFYASCPLPTGNCICNLSRGNWGNFDFINCFAFVVVPQFDNTSTSPSKHTACNEQNSSLIDCKIILFVILFFF